MHINQWVFYTAQRRCQKSIFDVHSIRLSYPAETRFFANMICIWVVFPENHKLNWIKKKGKNKWNGNAKFNAIDVCRHESKICCVQYYTIIIGSTIFGLKLAVSKRQTVLTKNVKQCDQILLLASMFQKSQVNHKNA
jgi:hypothetical protein